MSIENHPNLHAVGMTVDITSSLMNRLRGKAAEQPVADVLGLLKEDIQDFVVKVSTKLDETFQNE
jgi:malonyl CoA-acyl carrier protein transacylase